MASTVQNKRLHAQYQAYLNRNKSKNSDTNTFNDHLSTKKPENSKKEPPSSNIANKHDKQLKSTPTANSACHLGSPKKITSLQAKRLAKYAPIIEQAAKKYNVPVELICGVILQESNAKLKAVSHCGAQGLMQLMPGTAKRFGVTNAFDPKQNIDGGTHYLSWLMKRFDGNIELTLAAYNAGEGNVEKYGNKVPPFKETQNYIPKVLGYAQSMIDIFVARAPDNALPNYAKRA